MAVTGGRPHQCAQLNFYAGVPAMNGGATDSLEVPPMSAHDTGAQDYAIWKTEVDPIGWTGSGPNED